MTADLTRSEVTPILKPSEAKPWVCRKDDPECSRKVPCRSCLGRRSRRSGLKKQREARKALGIPSAQFAGLNGNEEAWRGAVRAEVKSGAQVGPVWTRYFAAEQQSEANKSVGDPRKFVFISMPPGITDGLVTFRLSHAPEIVAALYEQYAGGEPA